MRNQEQKSWLSPNPKLYDSVHMGVCSVWGKLDNWIDFERVANVIYKASYFDLEPRPKLVSNYLCNLRYSEVVC